jgi:hypothetical protein
MLALKQVVYASFTLARKAQEQIDRLAIAIKVKGSSAKTDTTRSMQPIRGAVRQPMADTGRTKGTRVPVGLRMRPAKFRGMPRFSNLTMALLLVTADTVFTGCYQDIRDLHCADAPSVLGHLYPLDAFNPADIIFIRAPIHDVHLLTFFVEDRTGAQRFPSALQPRQRTVRIFLVSISCVG